MLCNDAPLLVGLSSRVPGARTNAKMWDILSAGKCTISGVSDQLFWNRNYADPHQTRPGKAYSSFAGQLSDIYHFDAGFFGITPREAEQMDPQQRLMLQSVWEAVEDAGLNIRDLAGDRTGVFVGSSIVENLTLSYGDLARAGSSFSLGNTLCIIANRVSSVFDFRGTSIVMDAACASSLYAFHIAAEALRRGELDTAIVGGVHVARTPGSYVSFSQARMMSPTGLCRAFAAAADGYVRSEASVAVVLQRPDVAGRMGARRRARVLATGVNTDGNTSQLTVPSGEQQIKLIDRVLTDSDVDPEDFAFFEAHGTGTQVGDPIEAKSIGTALATLRRDPLLIGSSKTNFGHSEPAAGLVAMAKTLLSFEHGALPASLHFDQPNPAIDFEKLNLDVNTKLTPLPDDMPVFAGINSFGFGGTNVSIVLEAITTPVAVPKPATAALKIKEPERLWLLISAASQVSLQALAASWANRLDATSPSDWPELSAAAGQRTELSERLAVPLDDTIPSALRAFSENKTLAQGIVGRRRLHQAKTVLAFPGNGTQVAGMGRTEYYRSVTFRRHFDEIAAAFAKIADIDLVACLNDDDLASKLASPLIAQPLLFAYQIAYARSIQDAGFRPDAVVGHSVGEIAALHFAGCFDLQAAVHIIVSRSRAFEELRGSGTMAVVAAAVADVESAISSLAEPNLVIAAINSPRAVTVSGPAKALANLRHVKVKNKRLAVVPLKVEIPYHSPIVDDMHDRFMSDLRGLVFNAPVLPVASTVLGRMLKGRECNAAYLWRNARDQVKFADALTALAEDTPVNLVEISPIGSFAGNVRDLTRQEGLAIEHILPAAHEDDDFAAIAVRGWTRGLHIDLSAVAGQTYRQGLLLPAYPWDETEYFNPLTADGLDLWGEDSRRLLAGLRTERASPTWIADITPTDPTWIADHKVGENAVMSATSLVEIALDAGAELWPDAVLQLRDFDIVAPATVMNEGIRLRTMVDETTGALTISQRPRLVDTEWTLVARGTLRKEIATAPTRRLRPPKREPSDITGLYDFLAGQGLPYGPAFRRLNELRPTGRRAIWVGIDQGEDTVPFLLNPMSFDAALHGLAQLIRETSDPVLKLMLTNSKNSRALVPVRITTLQLWQQGKQICAARLQVTRLRRHSLMLDVALLDANGMIIADVTGAEFTLIDTATTSRIPYHRTRERWVRLRGQANPVALPRKWPASLAVQLGFEPAQTREPTPLAEALDAFQQGLIAKKRNDIEALGRVLEIAPELTNDLRALMLSAEGREARGVAMHSHAHRRVWAEAEALIDRLARGWKSGQRLNLLVSGMPDTAVIRRLMTHPCIDRIALTLPSDNQGSLLRATLPSGLRPLIRSNLVPGWADVILSTDAEPAETTHLAPGGLALRLDVPELQAGGGAPIGDAVWQRNMDGLTLRLSALRGLAKVPEEEGTTFAPTWLVPPGQHLPTGAAGLQMLLTEENATHQLLIHALQPEADLSKLLADLFSQLRKHATQAEKPIVLIYLTDDADPQSDMLAAALGSVVRTLTNEIPNIAWGAIVLRGNDLPPNILWPELIRMALTQDLVVASSEGVKSAVFDPLPPTAPRGPAAELIQDVPGWLEHLRWGSRKRRAPAKDQIEIAIAASGVNFRDVMSARGLLPERMLDIGATGAALGMECAGVVTRVGRGVTDFVPGDRVVALGSATFSTHLVIPQYAAAPIPAELDPITAAGIPVAFLTAWHALVDIARIKEGDSVLIHGAAGGVGLAAIQIARLHGARVLATASTSEKRSIAMTYGAEKTFNSRDLAFTHGVRDATNGQGVNIVLNSLAGEAMQRSVECLAAFGRFIELGKRDYLEGTRMDLRPFLHNLSYHGLDLDQLVAHAPEAVNATMRRITQAMEMGQLRPLPVTVFDASDTTDAFQHMLSSQHIGKIVITPPEIRRNVPAQPVSDDWIILGGTGGLGLAIGEMLLAEGAAHVHLLSRSGEIPIDNLKAGTWVKNNPRVTLHAVDAADFRQLSAFFGQLEREGRSLGGVIHSAMLLRDRLLSEIDSFEAKQVIRSKLGVAMTLDAVLRAYDSRPGQVIFFSSIAAQLGNIGQAAYSAANSAVESIAATRRRDGLPGVAVGWGPIRDAGYLTRDAVTTAQLSRLSGIALMSVSEVLTELRRVIRNPPATDYCYAGIRWDEMASHLPSLTHPAHATLVSDGVALKRGGGALVDNLRSLDWNAALKLLRQEICDMLGSIMRIPPEQFDLDRPLAAHGIDSLMAMEMRLEIEDRFGSQMPVSALGRDITGSKLAVILLTQIRNEDVSGSRI